MKKTAGKISGTGRNKATGFFRSALVLLVVLFVIVAGGKAQSFAGVRTDKSMQPGKALPALNEEIPGFTDIPLGESFILVNDNIEHLKEKKGKVSVGCSLVITDEKGKIIQEIADTYRGNDTFNKKDLEYMHCIITAAKPMEWGKSYDVVITFWDKYGTGKIINKLEIRIIDTP